MNREIKFRGKPDWDSIDEDYVKLYAGEAYKDGWVYGQLARNAYGMAWIIGHIVEWDEDYIYPGYWIPVDLETVGQYTGLKDKNGVEIYEGDICKYRYGRWTYIGKVVFNTHACIFEMRRTEVVGYHGERAIKTQLLNHIDKVEVIGNIHDNLELLEVLGDE